MFLICLGLCFSRQDNRTWQRKRVDLHAKRPAGGVVLDLGLVVHGQANDWNL